ncbi:hypothetical protein ILUMI_21375, partial [Ignelater luminosus]
TSVVGIKKLKPPSRLVQSGVPQESILGPTLYAVYIHLVLVTIFNTLKADDTQLLYLKANNGEDDNVEVSVNDMRPRDLKKKREAERLQRYRERDSVEDYGMAQRQDEMQKKTENISSDDSDIRNIGKLLETCEKLAMVPFELISVMLPKLDVRKLSTDQKYLYEICEGVESQFH